MPPSPPASPPPTPPASARVYSVPALEKAIDVVELLAEHADGLTISEIAGLLSRSISELFRVVVVLDRRGWLHKDPDSDRYRVTYRLLETAHRATPARELTEVAASLMRRLSAIAIQSCHLVVLNGTEGLIIARQESPGPTGFAVRVGTKVALATNCSGHILLAFLSEAARSAILDTVGGPPHGTDFAAIRARGHESIESTRMAGVSDMSCPIFGYDGGVVAALTIPFLAVIDETPHIAAADALIALKQTATRISQHLGWQCPGGEGPR